MSIFEFSIGDLSVFPNVFQLSFSNSRVIIQLIDILITTFINH